MSAARPFDDDEYAARRERVRTRMEAAGLDVLLVTAPANIAWLCGYEAVWYPPRLPLGLAIARADEHVIFYDWTRHEDYARHHALADEFVFFEYGAYATPVAESLRRRDWSAGATVGLERSGPSPTGAVLDALAVEFRGAGASVVDGSWVVDGARAFKSPAELGRIRDAAAMVDAAYLRLVDELRPGLTELQVAARLQSFLADEGSEIPAHSDLVSSGPTSWRDTHAFPSRRVLERGDVVTVDACGVLDRYHANLCRSFVLGAEAPEAERLIDVGTESLAILRRHARVGDGPELAMAKAEAHVREHVVAEKIWWVGGYSLGLALPPGWVGHTYLANDGPEQIVWDEGYVSNYEAILVDREGGYEVGVIDTIVMTGGQVEILSAIPRSLIHIDVA
jgi:Xaa-Pro aminopeptidase